MIVVNDYMPEAIESFTLLLHNFIEQSGILLHPEAAEIFIVDGGK